MMPLYGSWTARATDVRQAADFAGQGAARRDDRRTVIAVFPL
jgi:hypothetical protein